MLIQFLLDNGIHSLRSGVRKKITYVHCTGALTSPSGYGSSLLDAVYDALSRSPLSRRT